MIHITASDIIQDKIMGMQLGLLSAEGVTVRENDSGFPEHFNHLKAKLEETFPEKRPSHSEIVGHVRRMYRRIGWEPTQYRPSSEALVRRILKGKGLYRINNLVDYGNLVSAGYFLPMGLYDVSKILGTVMVDVGRSGETYDGIGRDGVGAEGKMILRDEEGIFGNPTADSHRTCITPQTRSALALFFCPPEVTDAYIHSTLDALAGHYGRYTKEAITTEVITL